MNTEDTIIQPVESNVNAAGEERQIPEVTCEPQYRLYSNHLPSPSSLLLPSILNKQSHSFNPCEPNCLTSSLHSITLTPAVTIPGNESMIGPSPSFLYSTRENQVTHDQTETSFHNEPAPELSSLSHSAHDVEQSSSQHDNGLNTTTICISNSPNGKKSGNTWVSNPGNIEQGQKIAQCQEFLKSNQDTITTTSSVSISSKTQAPVVTTVSLPLTPPCQKESVITGPSMLNRADLEEIASNYDLLTYEQHHQMNTIARKLQFYSQRYDHGDYEKNSAILILSDYRMASTYSMCSIANRVNRSGRCRKPRFCPYCNYLDRENTVYTYVPQYERGTWFHLTLSFSGAQSFTAGSAFECQAYWDACDRALREALDSKFIRGAYWVEEIQVLSLLPLRVMPHVHALVEADDLRQSVLDSIEQSMCDYLAKAQVDPERCFCQEEEPMKPNLHAKPINTDRVMLFNVRYLFKTIDLVTPYQAAWRQVEQCDRRLAVELNSQVKDFISGHFEITKGRDRMRRKGNLHASSSCYIGVKKNKRQEYRNYIHMLEKEGETIDNTEEGV